VRMFIACVPSIDKLTNPDKCLWGSRGILGKVLHDLIHELLKFYRHLSRGILDVRDPTN